MKTRLVFPLAALLVLLGNASPVFAQGTAFTYEGRLADNGASANGIYDVRFIIYTAATVGSPVGNAITNVGTSVSNGLFTVTLDPGAGVFTGAERWLEVAVKTNGTAVFTALSPRQKITATPYAIAAGAVTGGVAAGQLTGTIPLAQLPATLLTNGASSVSLTGAFSGNGAGVTNLNASRLASGTVPAAVLSNAWRIGGNVGTPPGTHFLGTTDYEPLELKVNNQRGLRLEPTAYDDTVNVIGGSARNFVGEGVVGATIGGGGTGEYQGNAYTNQVGGDFGTVSGGAVNTILLNAYFATIGGGRANVIQTNAYFATIGGGTANTIRSNGTYATIAGGEGNNVYANASFASIGGGSFNWTFGEYSTIGGGDQNTVQNNAAYSTIGGGHGNIIQNNVAESTIGGGTGNTIQSGANFATIGGGVGNTIQTNGTAATIPGGFENTATANAFAAGQRAKAIHAGAFVWADATEADFASTANNQFLIRAAGNVGINKSNPATALDVNGTVTATGFSGSGAGLTNLSGANLASGTVADARLTGNVALRGGGNAFTGNQTIAGSVVVDQAGLNNGAINSASLTFGTSSGEGIASKRTSGGNQYGLDFYTDSLNRMAINLNGNVGIGTTNPSTKLEVNGAVTASSFNGPVAASQLTGTIAANNIGAGTITSSSLAAGAAAANLNAAGQSGVASGGLVLSATENAALVTAGYIRIGGMMTTADAWQQRVNLPLPGRAIHTAVWTGNEMIVWGGTTNGANNVNDGGRYNPTANSWAPVSTTEAPGARQLHTAVWTGTEMIVWGGGDGGGYFNDGGRYNPAGNSWTPVSTNGAPAARREHTAVWTGSEMIVWGGFNGVNLNTGGRYNPATDNWTPVSTTGAPGGRRNHTAVWTGSEMIVWAGFGAGSSATGGRYNPAANSWTPVSTTGTSGGRRLHTAVWTGSEMFVWGGTGEFNSTGERYSPAGDSWATMSTSGMPAGRALHTAVWTGSEMIVWGGGVPDGFNDGGRYNPTGNSWTAVSITGAPGERYGHTAVWTGNEMIISGGYNPDGSHQFQYLNDTFIYTPGRGLYLYQRP